MAYSYSFFDNQTVGAEDLNRLTNLFVTGGVADNFQDNMPYSITKLNDVVYANGSAGIVPQTNETLRVQVVSGNAQISPGTAFFPDGTTLTIESTETLALPEGDVRYVYLKSDTQENIAYPAVSTDKPIGNVVLLAEIQANGTVTDKRIYAKGKIPSMYASDAGLPMIGSHTVTDVSQPLTILPGNHTYKKLFLHVSHMDTNTYGWHSYTFLDLETGETESFAFEQSNNLPTQKATMYKSDVYKIKLIHETHSSYEIDAEAVAEQGENGTVLRFHLKTVFMDEAMLADRFYPFHIDVYAV